MKMKRLIAGWPVDEGGVFALPNKPRDVCLWW